MVGPSSNTYTTSTRFSVNKPASPSNYPKGIREARNITPEYMARPGFQALAGTFSVEACAPIGTIKKHKRIKASSFTNKNLIYSQALTSKQ